MHRTTPPDLEQTDRPTRPSRRATRGAALLAAAGLTTGLLPLVTSTGADAATVGYSRFASCTTLVTHLRNLALPRVGPSGLDGGVMIAVDARVGLPTAAPAATTASSKSAGAPVAASPASAEATYDSSATNVQEVGVDEGDTVETDGRYLYSGITGAVRIIDTTTGRLVATLTDQTQGGEAQLLLDGPRLAVVRQHWTTYPDTTVELYDVRNPAAPNLLRRLHYEGTFQAVRAVDHRLRLVLQTSFQSRLPFVTPTDWSPKGQARATEANKNVVRKAKATDWLPRFYDDGPLGRTAPRAAIGCTDIGKPAQTSGLGLTWIATIDLDRGGAMPDAQAGGGVIDDGGIVYASANRVYVATVPQPSIRPTPRVMIPTRIAAPASNTTIHAFDLGPGSATTWVASGTVKGRLLNQFSMSEKDNRLRVATTADDAGFGSPQESAVRVLSFSGRTLAETGSVTGLGRTERIYAVRFIGDLGYVVTFRQTDPLYVVDLRNPARPRVAGELKIPGYSAYLHPVGDGLLLGIGQDASDEGRRLGTQVSLFDVRDPDAPKQLAKLRVGGSSEAEYDHHAFLWWASTGTLVVPITAWPQSGANVLRVDLTAATIALRGRIAHPVPNQQGPIAIAVPMPASGGVAPATIPTTTIKPSDMEEPISRSLVVAGRLVTVSPSAVRVSDLTTFASLSYLRFET